MIKTTTLLILMIFPAISFAQSVSCRPHGQAYYTKLEIYKPDDNFEVPWFMVRLENKYRQRKVFTVFDTSRGDKLLFIAQSGKKDFLLDFGSYNGPGVYHGVQLILNQGSDKEEKASLMCEQAGDLGFKNLCEAKDLNRILFRSARNRNLDELESILECGVNTNAKNKNGCPPLLLAADPLCGLKPPQVSYKPMTSALPIVDILTNNGALLETKDPVNQERALHKFTKLNDEGVVDLLLDLEADVNAQDKDGFTPLMRAVETNNIYLVQRIVEANPDFKIRNKNRETALAIAKRLKMKKLENLLQEPKSIIEVNGLADGTCSPDEVKIKAKEVSKFILKASPDDMFLLEAPALSLSLMAESGSQVTKNILPQTRGSFQFTCGVHGAQKQTTGKIIVE